MGVRLEKAYHLIVELFLTKLAIDFWHPADVIRLLQVHLQVLGRFEVDFAGVAADPDPGDDVVVLLVDVLGELVAHVNRLCETVKLKLENEN